MMCSTNPANTFSNGSRLWIGQRRHRVHSLAPIIYSRTEKECVCVCICERVRTSEKSNVMCLKVSRPAGGMLACSPVCGRSVALALCSITYQQKSRLFRPLMFTLRIALCCALSTVNNAKRSETKRMSATSAIITDFGFHYLLVFTVHYTFSALLQLLNWSP